VGQGCSEACVRTEQKGAHPYAAQLLHGCRAALLMMLLLWATVRNRVRASLALQRAALLPPPVAAPQLRATAHNKGCLSASLGGTAGKKATWRLGEPSSKVVVNPPILLRPLKVLPLNEFLYPLLDQSRRGLEARSEVPGYLHHKLVVL